MRGLALRSASFFVAALALVGGLSFASSASATVVVLHSLPEMTARADLIVHARVGEQRVTRENGRIVTLTEVEVIDAVKGAKPGEILTVYAVGGVLDGERTQVIGAYEYEQGEEMVFFGVRRNDRIISYGVGVGKYAVERNESGAKVVPAFGDVAVMREGQVGEPPRTEPRKLGAFLAEVRQHAERPVQLQRPRVKRPITPDMLRKTKLRPGSAKAIPGGR